MCTHEGGSDDAVIYASFDASSTTEYVTAGNIARRMGQRENQKISMRIDLGVLSSFDFIITTSTMKHQRMSMRIDLGLEFQERDI